ncbi:minor capsid protein [uncultured Lactobacillus sp.]|uniref:minor capsid protein n=1 Tax=uncultured Lactobacillus sp. TaxID=153152 RepID=UPI002617658B|nr:minor capsid protein [uncultured Lactobacillus sp.]
MGVKVHADLSGLNRKLSAESLKRARKLMANDALQAMNKYVPSSSQGNDESGSTLRGMSSVAEDGSSVMYRAIYARAQFYGFITNKYGGPFRIHNYTTPGTSRRWDLRLKGHKEDMNHVKEAFVKGLDLK